MMVGAWGRAKNEFPRRCYHIWREFHGADSRQQMPAFFLLSWRELAFSIAHLDACIILARNEVLVLWLVAACAVLIIL